MWTFCILVVVVPIVLITMMVLPYYIRFRRTPECRWRNRVYRNSRELERQLTALEQSFKNSPIHAMRDKLFVELLQSIPISTIAQFRGFGPGTVDRLKNFGLRTLHDAMDYPFETLEGFGKSKSADLKTGVKALATEALIDFQAGACAKGREFWDYIDGLDEQASDEFYRQDDLYESILEVRREIATMVEMANTVTFPLFMETRGEFPWITTELLSLPIPSIASANAENPVTAKREVRTVVLDEKPRAEPTPRSVPSQPVDLFEQALKNTAVEPATPPRQPKTVKQLKPSQPAPKSQSKVEEQLDLSKLKAFAGFGLMIAKVDGRVVKTERAAVRHFLASLFGHDPALARHLDSAIETVEKSIPNEKEAIGKLLRYTQPHERAAIFRAAEQIADANGKRKKKEIDLLARIAIGLGVELQSKPSPPPSIPAPQPQASPSAPVAADPRKILEIEPGVQLSVELIRRKFTLQFEKADPVKAATLGPEFAELAEKKRVDLRTAALALIAPFGEPLDSPAAPPPRSDIRHNPDLDDVFGG